VSAQRPSLLALLAQLVAIPSPTGAEERLGCWVEGWLAARGIASVRQPLAAGRFNLTAELGRPAGPAWLLAGHLDTVPPAAGWPGSPWELARHPGRAQGLGAWDMKGGVAALLTVAAAHPRTGPRLKLALLVDEEGESAGAQILAESDFLHDVTAALVPEAGAAPPGGLGVVIGRRGRVRLTLGYDSPAAHGAEDRGADALQQAARLVLALPTLPVATHPVLGQGRAVAMAVASSAAGCLSRPTRAELHVDRLLVPPEMPESARDQLVAFAQDLCPAEIAQTVTIPARRGPWLEPYCLPPESALLARVLPELGARGIPCAVRGDPSPADENRLVMAGVPTLALCPAGGNAHGPGEWIEPRSLGRLALALRRIVSCPPPGAAA
jgi:acetylornithine deacetylase